MPLFVKSEPQYTFDITIKKCDFLYTQVTAIRRAFDGKP